MLKRMTNFYKTHLKNVLVNHSIALQRGTSLSKIRYLGGLDICAHEFPGTVVTTPIYMPLVIWDSQSGKQLTLGSCVSCENQNGSTVPTSLLTWKVRLIHCLNVLSSIFMITAAKGSAMFFTDWQSCIHNPNPLFIKKIEEWQDHCCFFVHSFSNYREATMNLGIFFLFFFLFIVLNIA